MPLVSVTDSGSGSDRGLVNIDDQYDYFQFTVGSSAVICGPGAGSLPAVIGVGSSIRVWLSGQGKDAIYEML